MSIDGRWTREHETDEELNAGNRTPNQENQEDLLRYLSPEEIADLERVKKMIGKLSGEELFGLPEVEEGIVPETFLGELTAYDEKEVDKEYKTPESIKAIIEQLPEGVLDKLKELHHSQKDIDDAIANCTPEEINKLLANPDPDEVAKNLEEIIFQWKLDIIQS